MEQVKKLIEANDLDSAEKRIEQLLSQEPGNTELNFLMGIIYHKRNEIDKALATFSMLAAFNPKDYRSLFNLGLIHEKKGNREYAKEMYENVLKIKTDHKLALEGLKRLTLGASNKSNVNNSKTSISVESGKLMFKWSPKRSSSNMYYFYSFGFFLPPLFILINLIFFNFEIDILNVISGFCGVLSTFCLPYSVWCLATALRMSKSEYKVYENIVELKIHEGFSVKYTRLAMYDIGGMGDIELKSSFPMSLTDDAYISIPYDINPQGVKKCYNLFTYENYEKTKSVFDYIKNRSLAEKQRVNTMQR